MARTRRGSESYRVFISHSSRDRWVCERIKHCVEQQGAVGWLDTVEVPVGGTVPDSVVRGIRISDELLVLLSPATKSSEWVSAEIGMGMVLDLTIAPVLLHVDRSELPGMIRDKNPVDINELDVYLEQLRGRVKAKLTKIAR